GARVECDERVLLQREQFADSNLRPADGNGKTHLQIRNQIEVAREERLRAFTARADVLQLDRFGGVGAVRRHENVLVSETIESQSSGAYVVSRTALFSPARPSIACGAT